MSAYPIAYIYTLVFFHGMTEVLLKKSKLCDQLKIITLSIISHLFVALDKMKSMEFIR